MSLAFFRDKKDAFRCIPYQTSHSTSTDYIFHYLRAPLHLITTLKNTPSGFPLCCKENTSPFMHQPFFANCQTMRPTTSSFLLAFFMLLFSFTAHAQNCTQEEVTYLAANADLLAEVSQGCAFDCILSFDQDACILSCLSEQIEVSPACLACSVAQINCVLDECALACLNANSAACQNCINSNCLPPYFVCIGDDDVDGFTVEGGDCNNSNPAISPSALDDTVDGVDQNCDGVDGPVNLSEIENTNSFDLGPLRSEQASMFLVRSTVSVYFFDAAGRTLSSFTYSPGEYVLTPPNGAFLLRINSEKTSEVFKIQH